MEKKSPPPGTHFYFEARQPCGSCPGCLSLPEGDGRRCEDVEIGCVCGDVHYGEAAAGDLICESCNASTKDTTHPDPASPGWAPGNPCSHHCHLWSGS